MADILILTGPPAAGKTTAALALADRYDRVAHVQVDDLRHMITPTGYVHPWGPPESWHRQQALATRNACDLAKNFIAERFAVIIDDVVLGAEELALYVEGLKQASVAVHCVLLMPTLVKCIERNGKRREGRLQPERIETVWRQFESTPPFAGAVIDSSEMDANATADRLQALTTSGASIVWAPKTV